MLLFFLQEHEPTHGGEHAAGAHVHEPPYTIFTGLWKAIKDTPLGHLYKFDTEDRDLGRFWFDAICFSLVAAILLIVLASLATRNYKKIPRGIQNVFEWAVGLLRGLVQGFIPGAQGDKYLPYLGSVFLFIFTMNMLGVI